MKTKLHAAYKESLILISLRIVYETTANCTIKYCYESREHQLLKKSLSCSKIPFKMYP